MAVLGLSGRNVLLGSLLALTLPVCAEARGTVSNTAPDQVVAAAPDTPHAMRGRVARRGGPLQCVPFARNESGIEIVGNAATWWRQAAGIYERGSRPEVGSVLNFRANPWMPLGHVAVVTNVIDPRHLEIDHANWAQRGAVTRNIEVVDVSTANDWSAVRVQLGHSGDFGAVYPTYGFIYGRPDRGTMVAAGAAPAPLPVLNPAPRDLRRAPVQRVRLAASGHARVTHPAGYDEVAELPDYGRRSLDLTLPEASGLGGAR